MFKQMIHTTLTTHGHSDSQLLDQFVQNRDDAAFAALVRRHGGMVWAICRSQLSEDRHAAEDAAQATFLALAMNAERIQSGAALSGWLHRVAVRACHDLRRRRRVTSGKGIEQALSVDASPMQSASDRERERILHEELDRLPVRFRLPLVLTLWNNHSNAEVAQLLECAVGTVESRLTRARQRLRERLTQRGVTPTIVVGTIATPTFLLGDIRASAPTTVVSLAQRLAAPVLMKKFAAVAIAATMLLATSIGVGISTTGNAADKLPKSDKPMSVKENPLPNGAIARLGSPNLRHNGAVMDVAYTPDGKQIVSCGDDRTIRIWDNATGKQLHSVERSDGRFFRLLANKTQILALGEDAEKQCDLWTIETATGIVINRTRLNLKKAIPTACKFDDEGKRLGIIIDDSEFVTIYDTATCKQIQQLTPLRSAEITAYSFAFDPKSKDVTVAASNGITRIHPDGKQDTITHRIGEVGTLAYSPDGKTLFAFDKASRDTLIAYDTIQNKQLWERLGDAHHSLICTPTKLIQVGERACAMAVDWSREEPTYRTNDTTTFNAIVHGQCSAIHPNGKTIAFGSPYGIIAQFDLESAKPVSPRADPPFNVGSLHYSPDGTTLYGWASNWYAWDVKTQEQHAVTHNSWSYGAALSPQGNLTAHCILYGDEQLPNDPRSGFRFEILDSTSDKILHSYSGKDHHIGQKYVFTQDEKRIIGIPVSNLGNTTSIPIWSVETGEVLMRLEGHKYPATFYALAQDGKNFVTVSQQSGGLEKFPIRIWDITTGKQLSQLPGPHGAENVVISADGQRVALSYRIYDDKVKQNRYQVQIWDVPSQKRLHIIDSNDKFAGIALHPDGKTLALAQGKNLTLHAVDTGAIVKRFRDKSKIISIAYSPDGKNLASSSWQAPVLRWDVSESE